MRVATAQMLSLASEWVLFIAALVFAFDRGGARAAGVTSIVMLLPNIALAPLAGTITTRFRP